VVAVKRKREKKYTQPERHKLTVLLGDDLHAALETTCRRTGLSKNSVALLGMAFAFTVLDGDDPLKGVKELTKLVRMCLPR